MKLRNVAGGMSMIICGLPKSDYGKVVRCLRIAETPGEDEVYWRYEGTTVYDRDGYVATGISDEVMIPLNHNLSEEDLEVYHQEPVTERWS